MEKTDYLYQNENLISEIQKKYIYEIYINHNGNSFENIKLLAKSFRLTEENFLKIVCNYIKKNISTTDYSIIFDTLLLLETNNEIITYLNSIQLDLKYLRSNLLSYFIYFRPDIYFLNPDKRESLRNKLEVYRLYLKRIDTPPMDLQKKDTLEYSLTIIQEFIKSNFSFKRFCFQKRMLPEEMKKHSQIVKKNDLILYQEFENVCLAKKETMISEISFEIRKLYFLIQNGEIDSIDVFQNTNYSIPELVKYAGSVLNKEENIVFKQFIHYYENLKVLSKKGIEDFLNDKFVINYRDEETEITLDMKKDLLNYLQENNLPITVTTIRDTLKRKLNEKRLSKNI